MAGGLLVTGKLGVGSQGPSAPRSTVTGSPANASSAAAFVIPATRANSLARAMLACPCTVTWYPASASRAVIANGRGATRRNRHGCFQRRRLDTCGKMTGRLTQGRRDDRLQHQPGGLDGRNEPISGQLKTFHCKAARERPWGGRTGLRPTSIVSTFLVRLRLFGNRFRGKRGVADLAAHRTVGFQARAKIAADRAQCVQSRGDRNPVQFHGNARQACRCPANLRPRARGHRPAASRRPDSPPLARKNGIKSRNWRRNPAAPRGQTQPGERPWHAAGS